MGGRLQVKERERERQGNSSSSSSRRICSLVQEACLRHDFFSLRKAANGFVEFSSRAH
ncbi:GT-2-like 1, partial [Zea mays]